MDKFNDSDLKKMNEDNLNFFIHKVDNFLQLVTISKKYGTIRSYDLKNEKWVPNSEISRHSVQKNNKIFLLNPTSFVVSNIHGLTYYIFSKSDFVLSNFIERKYFRKSSEEVFHLREYFISNKEEYLVFESYSPFKNTVYRRKNEKLEKIKSFDFPVLEMTVDEDGVICLLVHKLGLVIIDKDDVQIKKSDLKRITFFDKYLYGESLSNDKIIKFDIKKNTKKETAIQSHDLANTFSLNKNIIFYYKNGDALILNESKLQNIKLPKDVHNIVVFDDLLVFSYLDDEKGFILSSQKINEDKKQNLLILPQIFKMSLFKNKLAILYKNGSIGLKTSEDFKFFASRDKLDTLNYYENDPSLKNALVGVNDMPSNEDLAVESGFQAFNVDDDDFYVFAGDGEVEYRPNKPSLRRNAVKLNPFLVDFKLEKNEKVEFSNLIPSTYGFYNFRNGKTIVYRKRNTIGKRVAEVLLVRDEKLIMLERKEEGSIVLIKKEGNNWLESHDINTKNFSESEIRVKITKDNKKVLLVIYDQNITTNIAILWNTENNVLSYIELPQLVSDFDITSEKIVFGYFNYLEDGILIVANDKRTNVKMGNATQNTGITSVHIKNDKILFCDTFTNKIYAFDQNGLETIWEGDAEKKVETICVNKKIIYASINGQLAKINPK